MEIIESGTTRVVEIHDTHVEKINREGYGHNKSELNNKIKYALIEENNDLQLLADIDMVKSNEERLIMEKCIPLDIFLDLPLDETLLYTDSVAKLHSDKFEGLQYWEKRRLLIDKTGLDFDEIQIIQNWGVSILSNELVLIDYSR